MEDSPADTTQNFVLSQPTGRTLNGPPSYVTKEGLTIYQEKVFRVYGLGCISKYMLAVNCHRHEGERDTCSLREPPTTTGNIFIMQKNG